MHTSFTKSCNVHTPQAQCNNLLFPPVTYPPACVSRVAQGETQSSQFRIKMAQLLEDKQDGLILSLTPHGSQQL